ncbi:MAG: hypothetical protein LBU06_08320 [Desulfovibrio sp.]|jgi:hypothetical protein|nr:hypothetical protein [Desulfovibrio sp.]
MDTQNISQILIERDFNFIKVSFQLNDGTTKLIDSIYCKDESEVNFRLSELLKITSEFVNEFKSE